MDTLFWTQLNPTVKFKNSKKQFYNKFLYKLIMLVPAGSILKDNIKEPESRSYIEMRISHYNRYAKYRRYHSVGESSIQRKQLADLQQINQYISFVHKHQNNLHLRNENPWLSVYSNDLELLKRMAKMDKKNLIEVHGPRDDDAKQALERGEIIVKRIVDYTHKVQLRELVDISLDEKGNILNFLDNLGAVVKLPRHCRESLGNPYRWIASSYFYTQDDSIVTMLNLIKPGIVKGIFKLSAQPDK